MELPGTLINGFQPLTNVAKSSILDVVVVLDTPLVNIIKLKHIREKAYILCNLKFTNISDFDFASNSHQLLDILLIVTVFSGNKIQFTYYNFQRLEDFFFFELADAMLPRLCGEQRNDMFSNISSSASGKPKQRAWTQYSHIFLLTPS